MHIVLVNMPWALIDVPSLALGILHRLVVENLPGSRVTVVHGNLEYVDWAARRRPGLDLGDVNFLALDSYFSGVGDWVFSSALHGDPHWREDELREELSLADDQLDLCFDLHRTAPQFIDGLAARITALEPDVVGFTTTFQQNIAALAAAKAIKSLRPRTRTVFGGANCDGVQGAALHRNFPFVDYVVRGEGERAFLQLLRALPPGDPAGAPAPQALTRIAGLCWRAPDGGPDGPDGGSAANAMSQEALPPNEIVAPDYTGYFERLEESVARDWVEPKLVIEGARGCWWGEKHHCTFCGLNGSFMQFRSKRPSAFRDEILDQVRRHQVLDMFVVDNILDMAYVKSLLPDLVSTGYDLRLHYEIKSNMRRDQLATLSQAGVVMVQPGIESLSSRVLKIMDKGVTGCHNVRMLRDAATLGITVSWNYLYGFPGEAPEDYLPILDQLPALHHLAPMEVVVRIVVERFSPYFNRPELGFTPVQPHAQYRRNYAVPESQLMDFAYLFSAPQQGVAEPIGDLLRAASERWQSEHVTSRLTYLDRGDEILLVSRRRGFDWTTVVLGDALEVEAFRLLDQPHSSAALLRKLRSGPAPDADSVAALLERWLRLGIVFTENDHYVHVVAEANNQDLLRFERVFDSRRAKAARKEGTAIDELEANDAARRAGAPSAAALGAT